MINQRKAQEDATSAQGKTSDKPKTSFEKNLLTHAKTYKKNTIKTKTKKTLTSDEVSKKCGKAPSGLSKGILEIDPSPKSMYRLNFEFNTNRKIPHMI